MEQSSTLTDAAALLAEPSRAAMLLALLDGRAYTANELARAANITPQTASFHLDKLFRASFVDAVAQGRYRYFRLASPEIGRTLEAVLTLHHAPLPRKIASSCPPDLRDARACFDHIAGQLGVRLYRGITVKGWLTHEESRLAVTGAASNLLHNLQIASELLPIAAKPCMDWSEREYHFAGDFGRLLMNGMLAQRWVLRGKSRALTLTEEGKRALAALDI